MHPVCVSVAASNESINFKKKQNWKQLYESIYSYMNKIIKECGTDSLKEVYISIDGVVPMAKIIQQRQRRFRSAHERYRTKTNWDSCLISPGTFFMQGFEQYLKHKIKTDECSYKIHLSDSGEFGEGEHKIMKRLRTLSPDTPIAIYGLDADLLILGISALSTHSNIQLFRENVHCALKEFEDEDYLLVHIQTLWNCLKRKIIDLFDRKLNSMRSEGLEPTIFELSDTNLIQDFILLTCYFGNDFIPAIPATSLSLEDSIHFVLTQYATILAEEGNYMIQSATDSVFYWNHPFLIKFWNRCVETEDSRMKVRTIQWLRRRHSNTDEKGPIYTFHSMPRKKQGWIRNALSSTTTYLNVFSSLDPYFDYSNREVQNLMTREWIRGSIWVLSYYMGIQVDPYWFYPWSAPPTFTQLMSQHHEVLKETCQVELLQQYVSSYLRKRHPRPNLALQLMIIIPPDSEYCVPTRKLRWNRKEHPRTIYTPDYHTIGRSLKQSILWANWSHECYPFLPLIELPFILKSLR